MCCTYLRTLGYIFFLLAAYLLCCASVPTIPVKRMVFTFPFPFHKDVHLMNLYNCFIVYEYLEAFVISVCFYSLLLYDHLEAYYNIPHKYLEDFVVHCLIVQFSCVVVITELFYLHGLCNWIVFEVSACKSIYLFLA